MRKSMVVGLISVALLLVGGVGAWLVLNSTQNEFSSATRDITSFTPYYFASGSTEGFMLEKDSVSYENGVLIFTMKNYSGKQLIFTEQATPQGYDIGSLQGDKEFKTPYGQAFITDGQTRTTGTLFTDDNAWILVNSPKPIGGETMQKILSGMKPRS